MYSKQGFQSVHLSFWSPSQWLSTRFESELDIYLTLSIHLIFYVIVLPFSSSLFIGTEEVMYISEFSSKHSNCLSNFFANFLIIKWYSYLEQVWNITGISFGILYLKLQMLRAAPPYLTV